jgi:hypothetical protein
MRQQLAVGVTCGARSGCSVVYTIAHDNLSGIYVYIATLIQFDYVP